MIDLTPALLPGLAAHRLPGIDAGAEAFYPHYDGYSLVNLPSSACRWLGVPEFGSAPLAAEIQNLYPRTFQHLILLLVDGLGMNALEKALRDATHDADYAVWGEIAAQGALAPLTSITPSTTAAALTTLWTGRAPAGHGVMAYEVWLKEYGLIANMILHAPASYSGDTGSLRRAGFDPETFLPVPTLGPHLARHGVRAHAFQHQAIARSGLSTMLLPGVEVMPFRSLGDLWVTLDALLDGSTHERTYTYIYWGDLDEHAHRFGPEDTRVGLELANFSRQLGYFLRRRAARSRQDTLLLITADHGHLHTPKLPQYELRNHPDLLDCLVMLPSGEARLPFVYLRPGCEERFLRYLESAWPGEFTVIPSGQAIKSGLFGPGEVYRRVPERAGDFLVVPRGGGYWWFANRDNPLLGRHGGMSRTEMLVPLLSLVI